MTSVSSPTPVQILPKKGLGDFTLGSSLHCVVTHVKASPQTYGTINLQFSQTDPITKPVVVHLPDDGYRLRFDGPDQRLRLIEVMNFAKIQLIYENKEIPKSSKSLDGLSQGGPGFRHVYRLFGVTYPGEYQPPKSGAYGTYILSYPGVAFSFPLLHSAWSNKRNFVSVMSSSNAFPAKSMSIFLDSSWPAARSNLFTHEPIYPRFAPPGVKTKEAVAEEIELVKIHGEGRLELIRKGSPPFWITLSETTPQDLIAELGPPDAIYRKNDRRIMIHGGESGEEIGEEVLSDSPGRVTSPSVSQLHDPVEIDHTPDTSAIEDSDGEHEEFSPASDHHPSLPSGGCFYNYFNHGFDIFISEPTNMSPSLPSSPDSKQRSNSKQGSPDIKPDSPDSKQGSPDRKPDSPASKPGSPNSKQGYPDSKQGSPGIKRDSPASKQSSGTPKESVPGILTATKITLHGNVPGSYQFNRHRRIRWTLDIESEQGSLNSEANYKHISQRLEKLFKGSSWDTSELATALQRGMVLNRDYGDGAEPSESQEEGPAGKGSNSSTVDNAQMIGNTEFFGFPGLLFEVLDSGAICCLTVY